MKLRILTAVAFVTFFAGESAYGQFQAYLAQVANGKFGIISFATTFIFFNDSNTSVTATLALTDNNGNPLTVTIAGQGTKSEFLVTLGPGATEFLQTDGRGAGAVGAATVMATSTVGVSAIFISSDNTVEGIFSPDGGGNFQGVLPAGSYTVTVGDGGILFSAAQFESMAIYNVGSLVVTSGPASGTYAIPVTATLSGTVSTGGLTGVLSSMVYASDNSAAPPTQAGLLGSPAASAATVGPSGAYQMILPVNRSYGVSASVFFKMGSNVESAVSYPTSPGTVTLSGSANQNISVPALPGTVTISGQVTDQSGDPVANAGVVAMT